MKHKSKLGLIALALVAAITLASAASFYFIFNQTSFEPDQYTWEEPWTVSELVDFVEATFDVTGSGYAGQTHNYDLTFKNVATEPNFILLSCDYEAKFIVGVDEEVLVSGSHSSPILYLNEEVLYQGTLAPSLFGVGNVQMAISNILWGVDEAITWTTNEVNSYDGKLAISAFTVTGASKTYETGQVDFTLTATDLSGTIVSFTVEVVELSQVIHTETDYTLVKDVPEAFSYSFQCENGGSLTMQLTITDAHSP